MRDYAQSKADGKISLSVARDALAMQGIDPLGLDGQDRKYLETIARVFVGGPVGVEAVAHTMNLSPDTLIDEVEPFLLRSELVVRTPRGRNSRPPPTSTWASARPTSPAGLASGRCFRNSEAQAGDAVRANYPPGNLPMAGGTASIDDMVREVKRGIFVTRLWYVNTVDPRSLLCTGMTRDGNFLIENGKITRPALNLRFNESPISALSKIEAIGPAEHAGGEVWGTISAPPLLISAFTFSSRSSGI